MLNNTLNTNEIKGSAGTGVTFSRLSINGRSTEFSYSGETPAKPSRLKISHQDFGTGLTRRRRSMIRFERTDTGQVDATQTVKNAVYVVADLQVGNMSSNAYPVELFAYLNSFMASLGASTTILYDGSGNGSALLYSGGL
jgi:hypothetical protein